MARQQYYSDPSQKHLEVYHDFSGGLNTVTANDSLMDSELTELINKDLGERGSVSRRHGMVRHLSAPLEGLGQGYFRYYRADGTFDEILAVNGKLYKDGVEFPITGLASFQNTRQIEAVQFGDKLFIATGTKLVQYDGTTASVVTPYAPQPLEALYIGTNGLADDPDNYLQDGESLSLRIDGVTVTKRYGVVNTPTTFEVFVSKPSGVVEYKYSYRKKGTETWTLGSDFSASRTYTFTPTETVEYELDIYARMQGEADTTKYARYILPSYKVESTSDKNQQVDSTTIQTCNRILLHWDRLILYGDTAQPQAMYASHLGRGDYFPVPNSLLFDNERREPLQALVRFRDTIIAFTPTTIQALYGKHPSEYSRILLNSNIGCIAPFTVKMMGNYVAFLSREGVYILKSVGYAENRMNVEKIDNKIDNRILQQTDACAIALNGQYHLLYPQEKKRFRMYYNLPYSPWVEDISEKLDFARFYEFDGVIYGQSNSLGHIQKFDETVWDDDGFAFTEILETKSFDFRQPYNVKKLKELQMLMTHPNDVNIDMKLFIYADDSEIYTPNSGTATVDSDGNVVWNQVELKNLKIRAGTVFGDWTMGESSFGDITNSVKEIRISGKCRRTRVRMENSVPLQSNLLGLAYIFKIKRV